MMARFLTCPQCGITRFMVKNDTGAFMVVEVSKNLEILPVKTGESLSGYNLALLFCLGCSWKGSKEELI